MHILEHSDFEKYLQPRPRDFHKGNAGHVLIVGGDVGFSGSVRLAAEAALRVGAGLVSVATRKKHAHFLNVTRPEIMCHAVEGVEDLQPLLLKADVIVIGPGLGQTMWSHAMFSVVKDFNKPMVVDADGLNLLSQKPFKKAQWILTPHPGEAARLLKVTAAVIQESRVASIKKIQKEYDGVCVLKGAGSLILGNDEEIAICREGNPGMATAGMGDVLSGVIGGLLGQSIPLEVAARLGVFIHASAGDLAMEKMGEHGLIASDLMEYLPRLLLHQNKSS